MTGRVATSHKTPGVQRDFDTSLVIFLVSCTLSLRYIVHSSDMCNTYFRFLMMTYPPVHQVIREYFNTSTGVLISP